MRRPWPAIALVFPAACSPGPALTPVEKSERERWANQPVVRLEVEGTLVALNQADASASLLDGRSGHERALLLTGSGPQEVAVTPNGRLAVVADFGQDEPGHTLTVIDVAGAAVTRTIELGTYHRPSAVQFFPDGRRLAVVAEAERSVLIVDLEAGSVLAAIPTGQEGTQRLALSPDGARIFVASSGSGTMAAIDAATRQIIKVAPAGAGASGIDVSPDGAEVWVANSGADTLTVIDARTLDVLDTLPCGEVPARLKFTPDGGRVLVSNTGSNDLAVFDAPSRREIKRLRMRPAPLGVLIEPEGRLAFVACSRADLVAVVSLESLKVIARLPAAGAPGGLGWSPLAG